MRVSGPWRKVLRDLLASKARTLLVVLSIAVGIFATGMVAGSYEIILRDLRDNYNAVNPAMAIIYTDNFKPDFIETIRKVKGVSQAEGRREFSIRVKTTSNEWRKLKLLVIPDYSDLRINKIRLLSGSWPPQEKQVLIERSGLDKLNAQLGDIIQVETQDGKKRELRFTGIVHDVTRMPTGLSGRIYGYITPDTAEMLGDKRELNSVYITVDGNLPSQEHIEEVSQQVWNKVEQSGRKVSGLEVLKLGEHPAQDQVNTFLTILGILGILSLFLSGFLIVNTISSTLGQQRKQIGIMKAIGASTRQIVEIYMAYIFVYALLALLLAVPLGIVAAGAVSQCMAGLINFDIAGFKISYPIIVLEVFIGFFIPMLAGLYPVFRGARITVYEAINSYGTNQTDKARGRLFDRFVKLINRLSRPVILSIRNTFRRRGRLVLTLLTLTISGIIFISVFSVRESLLLTLRNEMAYFNYDIEISMEEWYSSEKLRQEVMNVSGIEKAEIWKIDSARLLANDERKSESFSVMMLAAPGNTEMLKPILLQGRWLLPGDENAVVLSMEALKNYPGIKIGDNVIIKPTTLEGRKTQWTVVGIARGDMSEANVYTNDAYFSRVIGKVGRGNRIYCVTKDHSNEAQTQIAQELKNNFMKLGLKVDTVRTRSEMKTQLLAKFNIVFMFLVIMASLLGVVGGLGLMGTMSMNVIERTREIGVMRAIGASTQAVRTIFITEGIFIGTLSWCLAAVAAIPVGKIFSDQVGLAFMQVPCSFVFSIRGMLLWLFLVIILAAVASFLPAWNASRISVRDVLAYE